eukprot:TRINITY_DN8722_c0_g2_i1.p1 TRINITY_DN8722_c0_g2~~TRINITY_DN8722_c0_g2_i1.p1  ORF type:complete len:245 (+),score=56.45 TRINITY_DN8722_c0_g2_i1:123-857(+)
MALTGTVKKWLSDKGFGFITGADGTDYFCHSRDLNGAQLVEGQSVHYDLGEDRQGRKTAQNVTGDGVRMPQKGQFTGTVVSWIPEKGFGFLKGDHGEKDLFCHFRALQDGDHLIVGAEVYYNSQQGDGRDQGRLNACDVTGPGVGRGAGKGKDGKDGKGKGWGGDPWGGWGGWGGWAPPPGSWGGGPAAGAWGGAPPAGGAWGGAPPAGGAWGGAPPADGGAWGGAGAGGAPPAGGWGGGWGGR